MQRLALVELAGDAGALRGVGAVDEQEVGAHDPPVLTEGSGKRALRRGVLQPCDQQARGDPATLERRSGSEQVVVVLADSFRAGAGAEHGVDGQPSGRAEAEAA